MNGIVATDKLMFLLADDQDRTYYVQGGIVKKNAIPSFLKRYPDQWKDINLQFATNQKYFSTLRNFSSALKFVEDGELIVNTRFIQGAGTEEVMYLIILRANPAKGLNYYELEYKSRLDFSKWNPTVRTGCQLNTLQDDVFALVQAAESTSLSIPCNATNPKAIPVLFDGTLLQDKLNYQFVDLVIPGSNDYSEWAQPLTFVNNEGDSVGAIFNTSNFETISGGTAAENDYVRTSGNFINSYAVDTVVTIKGTYKFKCIDDFGHSYFAYFRWDRSVTAPQIPIFSGAIVAGQTYTVNINMKFTLPANEHLFVFGELSPPVDGPQSKIENIASSLSILFASEPDPSINYALRPLDLLQAIVAQITNGKFTADSNFFRNNNRKCAISGSSLRSFPDAVIQTSFADFFQSYTAAYNLGITVRNGVLWIEPVGDLYNSNNELINMGEGSDASLTVAQEFIYTNAKVGYQKQTYNKSNGRYEFNCTHNYGFPIYTVLNSLNLVSVYRGDSFGMEFIRTSYPDLDSTDDKGDHDVFTVMVSDAVGQVNSLISTAVSFTVASLILVPPLIQEPFSNSTIYNDKPTVSGVAQPIKTITIFVDNVIDGTTMSDGQGNWSYDIQTSLQSLSNTFSGVHTIAATAQNAPDDESSLSNVISITVNTAIQSPFLFTSPTKNNTLYNNLPLIQGIAPAGKVISLFVDGAALTTLITDGSGVWKFQTLVPLADGTHVITAFAPGLAGAPPVNITVNKNVSSPIITSIYYNEIVYFNQPLIRGVAIPATVVSVYLDGGGGPSVGGVLSPMGTAVADANGDWSFQVVNVEDADGNITVGIPEGLHVVSTTPIPINVLTAISGYRLMRGSDKGPVMDYDAIKLDDQYIPVGVDPATLPPTLGEFIHPETLYNIEETTPLRCLMAHANVLSPFLVNQIGQLIQFNGAEVNANLVTKKNGVTFYEGQSVPTNGLGPNLFWPYYLNATFRIPLTFNSIMTAVNNSGYITTIIEGVTIYCLPIGTMNMKLATNESQQTKLLVSGKTPLSSLLKIFSKGITLNIGKNMVYLSDKNPLHIVAYNKTPAIGYHFADLYDDWQKNRFPRWQVRPDYAQPWQKSDTISLQAITNGVGVLSIQVISILTGQVINEIEFETVAPSPVSLPSILKEAEIDLSTYNEGQYWCALIADGVMVGISEKIWIKEDWPNTLKIEYGGSDDFIDFYFSTGIEPMIRIQGEFLPWLPDSEVDIYEDEEGDHAITRGIPLKTRVLQLGTNDGLIADWMALKMNEITLLSNWRAEGYQYTRDKNSKFEREDNGPGVAEFIYKMEVIWAQNSGGVTFATPGDDGRHAVTYLLDATAFGRNDGVINVTIDNE